MNSFLDPWSLAVAHADRLDGSEDGPGARDLAARADAHAREHAVPELAPIRPHMGRGGSRPGGP